MNSYFLTQKNEEIVVLWVVVRRTGCPVIRFQRVDTSQNPYPRRDSKTFLSKTDKEKATTTATNAAAATSTSILVRRSCSSSNCRNFVHKNFNLTPILYRGIPRLPSPPNSSLLCNMSSSVVEDYIHLFPGGTVSRFAPEIAPASMESGRGYKSKDVTIDSSKPITGRVFLPDTPSGSSCSLTPIVVYFHGGGFCIGSTTWIGYHRFLGDFSFLSRSIVLSIDYRLAPENRLPTAYEDCYASLEWLSRHAASEPWLSQADISRVFLSGDSAGGNIAHQVAVKALQCKLLSINIEGLMLIHPYFGSEKRTKKEEDAEKALNVATNDMFWKLSIPEGSDRDYYGCNFEKDEQLGKTEWDAFPKVVVFVAGLDFLKERGVLYAEYMEKKMGETKVKVVEAEEEEHVFHVFNPESEATRTLQQQMKEFMKKKD